jgi:AcrR family transcriptional regulator
MIRTQDARQDLLQAGKVLFARNGLGGTTVRDLASEAGVNLSMVSYHFGGKEGLYRACIEEYGKQRMRVAEGLLQDPVKSAEDLRVRTKLMIQSMLSSNIAEPEIARILHREAEQGLPIAREVYERTFLVLLKKVVDFVKSAQKNGVIRPELDALYLATLVHGTIFHALRMRWVFKNYLHRSVEDAKQQDKLTETLLSVLLEGSLST